MARQRPNVVLLVADELVASALRCYGGTQIDTPGLDRLSAEGATFDAAYCNSPVCTPSRYSMLSGRRPWNIGVYHNQSPTPAGVQSIAGLLGSQDYETVAIGKMHFKGDEQMWGYQRRPYGDFGGLSHQPDPLDSAPRLSFVADAGPADIAEDEMQDRIVGRIGRDFLRSRDTTRPFFLHLSFNFPHYPLRPPLRLFNKYFPTNGDFPQFPSAPEREHPWMQERRAAYRTLIDDGSFSEAQIRRARAAYYACVEVVDEEIQGVLRTLDEESLAEETVVIFTADHGEMLGEHGTWEKNCFYEQAVRVPLLVRCAGTAAGSRVGHVVELVDLFPTIREVVGVEDDAIEPVDGESLVPLIGGSGRRDKDFAISELAPTYVDGLARMVRRDRWKYLSYDNAAPSLFDLEADPHELRDLGISPTFSCPEPSLVRLAEVDFEKARRNAESAELAVHPPYADMTPNQYCTPDESLTDAENFYDIETWLKGPKANAPRRLRPRRVASWRSSD